ncbi:MAG TPA: sulfotransferase domain-containing protein [Terriglobales bacterium]|nr:sulfotransferase domain-containing protein [Terriglobales bacterium]
MITVVSGLPRSGTSLMMQMIVAGGMAPLTDGLRTADENNPKGYYEWEPAKGLKQNPGAITAAEGKVVKIISALLPLLPDGHVCRIVFMMRPLEEVIASQNSMLRRMGKEVPNTSEASVRAAFEKRLRETGNLLAKRKNMTVLKVEHARVLADPMGQASMVAEFLGTGLSVEAMAARVERALHRERAKSQDLAYFRST